MKLWLWPGNTGDQTVLKEVKAGLAGWWLNRTVRMVHVGANSETDRKVVTE